MVNKLWYLAMQDSHHGTWHYVITVWRHLIFWWIWVPGFQTKILWKLIWSVVFKFKRYFIDYNIAYNIYHTWYMVKRVSVSESKKVDFLHHSCTIMHHNSPLIAPAKTKSITHHSRWGGGGPRGGGTNTAVNFQNSLSIVIWDRGHLPWVSRHTQLTI